MARSFFEIEFGVFPSHTCQTKPEKVIRYIEALKADAERWQYLVRVIRNNRAEWEAIDEIFEAARLERWVKPELDDAIDKTRQQGKEKLNHES